MCGSGVHRRALGIAGRITCAVLLAVLVFTEQRKPLNDYVKDEPNIIHDYVNQDNKPAPALHFEAGRDRGNPQVRKETQGGEVLEPGVDHWLRGE